MPTKPAPTPEHPLALPTLPSTFETISSGATVPTLARVGTRLFGTPLAVTPQKLAVVLGAIGDRFGVAAVAFDGLDAPTDAGGTVLADDIAVIGVHGSLVKRATAMDAESGLLSYAMIQDAIATALDDTNVGGILLELDSHGGEVAGLFDFTDWLAAQDAKPIWAFVDESAYSAAYAIAAATDRIIVAQTGGVGSIGVLAVHIDQSRADEQRGLAYTFVHAGAHKVDFSPHAPLKDAVRARIQADVDRLHARFISMVAAGRGLTPAAVAATEADIFHAERGIALGLADAIGTRASALAALRADIQGQGGRMADNTVETPEVPRAAATVTDLDEVRAKAREEATAEAKAAELARSKEIRAWCDLAKASAKVTEKFIADGVSVEQVRAALLEKRVATEATLDTTVGPQLQDGRAGDSGQVLAMSSEEAMASRYGTKG